MDSSRQPATANQAASEPSGGSQAISADVAPLLLYGAFGLFAIYVVVVLFDISPPRLLDPLWLIAAASTLVNAVSLPLGGVLFVHIAGGLAPMDARIHQRRRLVSRLAAWAACGYLLLIPLLGWATWKGVSNVRQGSRQQAAQIERRSVALNNAIDQASSPVELQQQMVRLQGPQLSTEDLQVPLPQLKTSLRQLILRLRANLLAQLPRPTSEAYLGVYKQALRSLVLSVVSAVAFASLVYDPLRKTTLLGSLIGRQKNAPLNPVSWRRWATRIVEPIRSALSKRFAPDSRKLFWSQVKEKEKRASALRARELKRNADNMRKLQRERERKRLMEERQRNRQERRDRNKRKS